MRSSGDLVADRRYAWAAGALAEGDVAGAADLAEQVIEIAPGYAPAWFLLGECLTDAGADLPDRINRARAAFSEVLAIDPEDSLGAGMRLAQMGGHTGGDHLAPAYVRALFDGYAERFDRHLVEGLGYRAPAILREAILRSGDGVGPYGRVLDLGCGTGLMARALEGMAVSIEGVDLSTAMLAKARMTGLYDALHEGELVAFLSGRGPATTDLITAADVLVYVGDLGPAFAAAARVLRPGGILALTLQSHPGGGATLGPDGRYAHGRGAVEAWATLAGLELIRNDPVSARRQGGRDVPGWLVLLRRP